ncbi:uncharacterized protein EV422DRAFT_616352 [Fimicolochytrium jonesii]|uniref:uncharacterized protein n=1 Tax=Fimicolochytrium jonesii TaxID=1396493 RepID=UPI0022FDF30B|nr:uncharacterized protein EV422DRAFT_616352 [Fimicolochytrium jonesii]KAI8826946.1 hypothetical protein EV422DRAFT_616352 [Fimicolochytrium jonesii]
MSGNQGHVKRGGNNREGAYGENEPTLAVEREDPELIASFDKEVQDEAQTGEHPNDFGTGAKFGFASENYPHEKQHDISSKGGKSSGPSRTKAEPAPHENLRGIVE